MPSVKLIPAPKIVYPGARVPEVNDKSQTDCHSPGFWDSEEQRLYIFNSWELPWRTSGTSLYDLGPSEPVTLDVLQNGGEWLEGIWKVPNGKLYGWYHLEPDGLQKPGDYYGSTKVQQEKTETLRTMSIPPGSKFFERYPTKPKIGALVSEDKGKTWKDLGFVLSAPEELVSTTSSDAWYFGGEGDFGTCVDKEEEFVYFFITTFYGGKENQGLGFARMSLRDLGQPVGKVWKWRDGAWQEPGIGGYAQPVIPVFEDWHSKQANAFWGPVVHWNTWLNTYVMFLNRVNDGTWNMEGYYVSFNPDISNPLGWSEPVKVLDGEEARQATAPDGSMTGWYVSIFPAEDYDNDNRIGRRARLFATGTSLWEIEFEK